MLYLDLKYLNFIQSKLVGFVRKKDHLFNTKCPFCSDCQSKTNKKRGYFFAWKNEMWYHCHNCSYSAKFGNFLKKLDPFLYEEYKVELFKEKFGSTRKEEYKDPIVPKSVIAKQKQEISKEDIFYSICVPLSDLPNDHPAVVYCLERKIPKFNFSRLYYIDNTEKLKKLDPELDIKFPESRLVIPFFDKNKELFGLTCRAIKPTKLRYLTVKLSDKALVFGLDRVDPTKIIYIVEGPLDSLFLPNSIAVTGTSFGKVEQVMKDLNIAPDQSVLIIDNQPRNKEVVKIQEKLIDLGYNVVIWSIDDSNGKDINDLIKNGLSPKEVFQSIRQNTFRGLEAKMKFINWKKC